MPLFEWFYKTIKLFARRKLLRCKLLHSFPISSINSNRIQFRNGCEDAFNYLHFDLKFTLQQDNTYFRLNSQSVGEISLAMLLSHTHTHTHLTFEDQIQDPHSEIKKKTLVWKNKRYRLFYSVPKSLDYKIQRSTKLINVILRLPKRLKIQIAWL